VIADAVVDRGLLPDPVLRAAIRLNCALRLRSERRRGATAEQFAAQARRAPIALVPEKANEQHYEVPASFFRLCLGPRLKYSACFWPEGVESLTGAEEAMLDLTCRRAGIEDGMDVLDLGCGWGSLSFWLRERYPATRVLAVSNSAGQRAFIEAEAARRSVGGLDVVTADANVFTTDRRFDRIVSVEMLEHVRNHEAFLARAATWLHPGGRLFAHVFAHRRLAYAFDDSWMARTFFSGGTMPAHDLLPLYQRHLRLVESWALGGMHYCRTAEAWLERLDANTVQARGVLADLHGTDRAEVWLARWRTFFLACAELFGYRGGTEWIVSHHLFERPPLSTSRGARDGAAASRRTAA
jgi:cyclopropane-fatty-acyl-phospholipid synthase